MTVSPRRIAVLYSRLSGYVMACLKQLKDDHDVELLVVRIPPAPDAPFDPDLFAPIDRLIDRPGLTDGALIQQLESFRPDGVLMAGWFDRGYMQAARRLKARGVPVIAGSDAQWHGTLKQRLGVLAAPRLLHPSISALWVTGERQRQLAERLGYHGPKLMTGYYACDWERFAEAFRGRSQEGTPHLLFVGRYVPVKGIDVLVDGYRQYREMVDDPWPLVCVGTGPEAGRLQAQDGILNRGFVQPDALPDLMREAAAFILPSRREPWGVALHEASTAGLPLISSDACGAAVHLLRDGYNGFVFENGNAGHLAAQFQRLTTLDPSALSVMSTNSHRLSQQYTPALWASTLVGSLESLRA